MVFKQVEFAFQPFKYFYFIIEIIYTYSYISLRGDLMLNGYKMQQHLKTSIFKQVFLNSMFLFP